MQISFSFMRIIFLILCVFFMTAYTFLALANNDEYFKLAVGMIAGLIFGFIIITLDILLRRFNLRAFNLITLGVFFGYLMGEAILLIFQTIFDPKVIDIAPQTIYLFRVCLFLLTMYLGMIMTIRASDELHVSIPFFKFTSGIEKKKDLILDSSILLDSRLIDLVGSGLLDHHLIIPRFLIKECCEMIENPDENIRNKARRILDVVKKLENIPNLALRYTEADFSECKDFFSKLVRLARLLDANILSADSNRTQNFTVEGVLIINIHMLSNALKPVAQTGECINIKILRYGKEARQGVGYLEDGTMVVVNGGAEFIGETKRAQVLSVKHSSSGRMIFCNVLEAASNLDSPLASLPLECENANANNFFAL